MKTRSVSNARTATDTGCATPIAYATFTSQRSASPAATTFFATYRAAYAAERSTLVGSFPEKAPPPCRAAPPYVSTMILRPVRPVSPIGPPSTNFPTGKFVLGGPMGDTGLTGRKIIVDTYGGAARHGGGAFSGKHPTKVDRSAAYAARYVAKNIVAAGIARQCQVQLSYAIGVAQPINVTVYTEGTGRISDEKIAALVNAHFDLRPKGIIQMLDLLRPIYLKTAAYGHFGRDEPEFTWEATDKVDELRAAAGL